VVQALEKFQSTHAFYIHGHDRSESDFKTFRDLQEKPQRNLSLK